MFLSPVAKRTVSLVLRSVNTMTHSAELLGWKLTQDRRLEEPSGNSHAREGMETLQKIERGLKGRPRRCRSFGAQILD